MIGSSGSLWMMIRPLLRGLLAEVAHRTFVEQAQSPKLTSSEWITNQNSCWAFEIIKIIKQIIKIIKQIIKIIDHGSDEQAIGDEDLAIIPVWRGQNSLSAASAVAEVNGAVRSGKLECVLEVK